LPRIGWEIDIVDFAPPVFLFERAVDVRVNFDDHLKVFASQFIKRTRSHCGHGCVAWAVLQKRRLAEEVARHQGRKVTPLIPLAPRDADDSARDDLKRVAWIALPEDYLAGSERLSV